MIYLLVGNNSLAKDEKIAEIKETIFAGRNDALQFDFEVLHGHKLTSADLKKSLITLPAVVKKRLILIRQLEKLTQQNKTILIEIIEQKPDYMELILDTFEPANNAFYKKVTSHAKVFQFGVSVKQNVFDMTKALSANDPVKALKILNDLYIDGQHPLQIMGGLVWYWGKNKNRIAGDQYQQGLLELQRADLNIKRSRINPEEAVEILVVKLANLQ